MKIKPKNHQSDKFKFVVDKKWRQTFWSGNKEVPNFFCSVFYTLIINKTSLRLVAQIAVSIIVINGWYGIILINIIIVVTVFLVFMKLMKNKNLEKWKKESKIEHHGNKN
jgi:hypothetical protein